MKLPKIAALSALIMLFLPACHIPTAAESAAKGETHYRAAVESWRGAHIDELTSSWPRKWFKDQTVMADESIIFTFIWTEEYYRQPEQYFDHANNEWIDKDKGGVELLVCETIFLTDSRGVITAVRPGTSHCGLTAAPPARVTDSGS